MSESDAKDEIVACGPQSLLKRNTGIVRRGLQDLTALEVRTRNRIIVADHNEPVNEFVGEALRAAGYEVRTTEHPSEVMALADSFQPEVAIIALIAPEIDGVKLSEQLSARFPRLKIVLLRDVEEGILQHLLDKGINCDILETPFERHELLDMMTTWMRGSDYIDPKSRLRVGEHFRKALANNLWGIAHWKGFQFSVIFVELFHSASSHLAPELDSGFLRLLGATLGRFAAQGFAYRYEQNQFAMVLPRVGKQEACEIATKFSVEVESLLKSHGLSALLFLAVAPVNVPDDAKSVNAVREVALELIAIVKASGHGGVAAWQLGVLRR